MNPQKTLVESGPIAAQDAQTFREPVKSRYARTLGAQRSHRRKQDAVLLSIIVPVFNERPNLRPLVQRITQSLRNEPYGYELIFVDDHSSDRSVDIIRSLAKDSPVQVLRKKGRQGKSYSLLEGFQQAQGSIIAMIDADLQYPPPRRSPTWWSR